MSKGFIGATGYKAYLGATKMKAGYIGATRVYSAGSTVTYVVDNGVSYTEEVDSEASCLSPKSFTPTKSGWIFWGWRQDTSPDGNVLTSLVMEDHPITLYAVYAKSVTVTYYNESTGAIKDVKNRYYNSGSITNPTFMLHQAAKSGWTPAGWAVGNGSVAYSNGTAFTRDSDITLYGKYNQTITVTYYNGTTSTASATGTRSYYSGTGAIANPTFTLTQATMNGWTARGWSTSTAGNGGITYANGAAFTRDSNITLYGMYQQSITLTYYNGSSTASTTSGTRYYNPGSGNISNPAFTLTPASLSGWTFRGWATSSAATAGITYSSISNTAFGANTTVYAAYSQTITLSYNGNGATSGSIAAQTGTRYWNTGNVSNPSFTLPACAYTYSGATFKGWSTNSAAATGSAAGTTVTLSSSATYYAIWYIPKVIFNGTNWMAGISWSGSIVADDLTLRGVNNHLSGQSSSILVNGCTTLKLPPMSTSDGGNAESNHFKIYNQNNTVIGQILHGENWYQNRSYSLEGCTSIYFKCAAETPYSGAPGGAYIQFLGKIEMS
ncbi:MAG: hypothetical protein HDR02_00270 [Lachnospiraceae bacterium]|nr:hypothetical protein [Lachnospiraceae bacterium]